MSEIKGIHLTGSELHNSSKSKVKNHSAEGKEFSEELLRTVEKLEKMGNEIDSVMKANTSQTPSNINTNVHAVGKWINSIEGLIENFSGEKSEAQPNKRAMDQYSRIAKQKDA
ncbi:MAG: hypothetical protein ACI86H_002172 [bacterium]|jgi:hypothetical protein